MKRLALLLFVVVADSACESESGTTGKRVSLHTEATAEAATRTQFTTGFGWDVTLSKAALAMTALYYFDGPPPTALWTPPKKHWSDYFIKSAYAHPGHYQAGTAVGQLLLPEAVTLDLFGPLPVALPSGEGITGVYRSARLVIPDRTGHIAVVEGTAKKHGDASATPIAFRLVADYADIEPSIVNGAVDGCVLDEVDVQSEGTVTLEVKPTVWLNLVDFSKLTPGVEARDAGFSQGLTQLSAYHFRYAKP